MKKMLHYFLIKKLNDKVITLKVVFIRLKPWYLLYTLNASFIFEK